MVDKETIDLALKTFADALPEKPKWVIILTYKGKFVGRYGEYEDEIERETKKLTRDIFGDRIEASEEYFKPLDDETVTKITHEDALATMKLTEQLKFEHDTFTIPTGAGSYIIWFTYRFIIGVNYSNVGIASFDKTLDAVYHKIADLYDTIAPMNAVYDYDDE